LGVDFAAIFRRVMPLSSKKLIKTETMKNPNYKREQRFPFAQRFLTGLIIALAFSLSALEWTTIKTIPNLPELEIDSVYFDDEVILPPIQLQKQEIQALKPKPNSPEIKVVPDFEPTLEVEPEDELENKDDTPTNDISNKNELLNLDNYGPDLNYSETELDKIHAHVELFAHYDHCKELRGEELEMCSKLSIMNEVTKLFRVTEQMKAIGGRQTAFMTFVIDKEGNISAIETVEAQNKYIAKAAKTALEKLPKMNPAMQQGRAVSLRVKIPITVRID